MLPFAPLSLAALASMSPHPFDDELDSIDGLLAATYDVISGEAGQARDWDRFRSLFHPELGRLTSIQVGQDGTATALSMTPEEYIERAGPFFEANGFYEREVARRVERYGHIAHVFSTYESVSAPGEAPFARGINSFQLQWDGERWYVLSILWDSEREGQPIPEGYLRGGRAEEGFDPKREFDFWVGEWSVSNRHLNAQGAWIDGDTTRARITPVCGGGAILEEWAGPFRGSFMNGFSLRAFDPERGRWALLLNWTTDGRSGFGQLEGAFRHGRGEFFNTTSGPQRTRYTFSDALPHTVRWDSAATADGGRTWTTDWIMEFVRSKPAAEVTQDLLFAEDWTTGTLSPFSEARALDWMLGTWEGTQRDAEGNELEARLRVRLLNQDCLVLDLLETRPPGSEDWSERLCVRGFVPGQGHASGRIESWRVDEADTRLRRFTPAADEAALAWEHVDPGTGAHWREALSRVGENGLRIEEVLTEAGRESRVVTELKQVDG